MAISARAAPPLYVDSCGFIDLVKHRLHKPLAATDEETNRRMEDCWFLRRLCDAARDGAVQLMTSILSVGECLHIGDIPPDQTTQDLFHAFLTSGEVVELIEADIFVAEDARRLCWDHGLRLRGADGIHLASAIGTSCLEFLTTDRRIADQATRFGNAVSKLREIGINVIRASQTQCLPNEYRTDDLFEKES